MSYTFFWNRDFNSEFEFHVYRVFGADRQIGFICAVKMEWEAREMCEMLETFYNKTRDEAEERK